MFGYDIFFALQMHRAYQVNILHGLPAFVVEFVANKVIIMSAFIYLKC